MTYTERAAQSLNKANSADSTFGLAYALGCAVVYALLAIAAACNDIAANQNR